MMKIYRFLALGKDAEWSIERLEKCLIQATMKLPPEQACWSHARLHSILSLATSPDPPDEMQWNEASARKIYNNPKYIYFFIELYYAAEHAI